MGHELQGAPVVGDLQLVEERLGRREAVQQRRTGVLRADDHQLVQVAVVAGRSDPDHVESRDLGDALGDGLEGGSGLAVRPAGSADRALEVNVVGHWARF